MTLLQVLAYLSEALPVIEKVWQWYINKKASQITAKAASSLPAPLKAPEKPS